MAQIVVIVEHDDDRSEIVTRETMAEADAVALANVMADLAYDARNAGKAYAMFVRAQLRNARKPDDPLEVGTREARDAFIAAVPIKS